ncbi:MAG: hypothetical protein EAZ09_06170 [Oscillatoriales cyanobacterium]|nr:MAG: hypothetical protein EAZ18_14090 [Oscillatoriales cyanobacterium]TAH23743.1 MAG: hypothetical protein EAZ09_06170 [Oscillatoriales cyanobacterium]
MQNPGDLVTVKAAIKPPGFQVFLFNQGSNYASVNLLSSSQFGTSSATLPCQSIKKHLTNSFNQIAL